MKARELLILPAQHPFLEWPAATILSHSRGLLPPNCPLPAHRPNNPSFCLSGQDWNFSETLSEKLTAPHLVSLPLWPTPSPLSRPPASTRL